MPLRLNEMVEKAADKTLPSKPLAMVPERITFVPGAIEIPPPIRLSQSVNDLTPEVTVTPGSSVTAVAPPFVKRIADSSGSLNVAWAVFPKKVVLGLKYHGFGSALVLPLPPGGGTS